MTSHSTTDRPLWTTVFSGPLREVLICQGLLETSGMMTHVLNQDIKIIDPFITGGDAFSFELQVPRASATEARELLALRPEKEDEPDDLREPETELAEKIGNRIRWASITMITAPFALWLAPRYFLALRAAGRKPRNHFWTIFALVFAAALTLILPMIFLRDLTR